MENLTGVIRNERKGTWNYAYFRPDKTRTTILLGKLSELTREQACERAREFLEQQKNQSWTVERVAEEYSKVKLTDKHSISKRTNYAYLLKKILGQFGGRIFEELEDGEIEDWLESLSLAQTTKGELKCMLSRLWKFAAKRKMVPKTFINPMSTVEIPGVSIVTRRTEPMTRAIFFAFVRHLIEPFATFAYVSIGHSLRLAEALGLKWKDINFEKKTIFIRRTVVRGVVQERTKTEGSTEEQEMDEVLIEQLEVWRLNTPFPGDEDWVFPSPGGWGIKPGEKPYRENTIRKHYQKAAKAIGLARANTHVMRFSHCEWGAEDEVDIKVLQFSMRHKKAGTTQEVYRVKTGRTQAAAMALRKRITRMAFGKEEGNGTNQ